MVVSYGVLANNNEKGGGRENNYLPRYFQLTVYLMSLVSVSYLFWALKKLYVVLKYECARKLDVNNTAITLHLVCFSLYLVTSLFSITTNVLGEDWISSVSAKTALFILSFTLSSISQLIIIYIFFQISRTVRKVQKSHDENQYIDTLEI